MNCFGVVDRCAVVVGGMFNCLLGNSLGTEIDFAFKRENCPILPSMRLCVGLAGVKKSSRVENEICACAVCRVDFCAWICRLCLMIQKRSSLANWGCACVNYYLSVCACLYAQILTSAQV